MRTCEQGYVNHIAVVVDESSSMHGLASQVVRVADEQIAYLARRSQELDQETRVTVYTFANEPRCVFYDKDVLRLPSLKDHYRPNGMTALVDAALLSLDDLALTPEKYGDHAFLVYLLTDGQENHSNHEPRVLERRLAALPGHWTVAVLVPDQTSKFEAKKFGFPADNIGIWETNARGLDEAGRTIRDATDRFMVGRATGVRGTRNLFSTGADAVNISTIAAAALVPLDYKKYTLVPVPREAYIKDFVEACGLAYRVGSAYYQLMKTETIQPQKDIAIVGRQDGKVYMGRGARDLLGLPDMNVRVKPDANPKFDVFVQSTSVNRKLIPGTRLLVML